MKKYFLATIGALTLVTNAQAFQTLLIPSDSTKYISGGRVGEKITSISGTSSSPSSPFYVGLYQKSRWSNSKVKVPLSKGEYDVVLKFAETYWTAKGKRKFHVYIEGKKVLSDFDVFAAGGGQYRAVDRTFRVAVDDGNLDIEFRKGSVDNAMFSAIYIDPASVLVRGDEKNVWSGGSHTSNSVVDVEYTDDDALFARYRNGASTLNYPLKNGLYEVSLKFAEMHHSSSGKRRFNVEVEGSRKLTNYDIYSAAKGKRKAVERNYLVDIKDGALTVKLSNGSVDKPAIGGVEIKGVAFGKDFKGTSIEYGSVNHKLHGWEDFYPIGGILFNQSGSTKYAYPEIVLKDGKKTLYGRVIDKDPAVSATTRFQLNLFPKKDRKQEVYEFSHRVYLGNDIAYLTKNTDSVRWFTLIEIWNEHIKGMGGNGAGSARWGLAIHKDSGSDKPFYWRFEGEQQQPVKHVDFFPDLHNRKVPVPFGKWVTLRLYLRRGEGSNGHIKITMTPDARPTEVLFDARVTTQYPGRPDLGMESIQPMKLYTDDKFLDWMRDRGKKIEAWYSDFRWYK